MIVTHGMSASGAYRSYYSARERCLNPNHVSYPNYGGRGIKFLYTSFEQFLADVGERPDGSSIERIDNNGHYEVGNCKWATTVEQNNNRRNNRLVTAFGRARTVASWAREHGKGYGTVRHRLRKLGWHPRKP
jgi:hypothetical protein